MQGPNLAVDHSNGRKTVTDLQEKGPISIRPFWPERTQLGLFDNVAVLGEQFLDHDPDPSRRPTARSLGCWHVHEVLLCLRDGW
jgi:hypothetical protein